MAKQPVAMEQLPVAMQTQPLPALINPNHFPGKLWRLVNSPCFRSISWDARGEGLLVNQPLFESELLGAGLGAAGEAAAEAASMFKTKNFTSFIRQLNLYGFRKVVMGSLGLGAGNGHGNGRSSEGLMHHFHNPNFCRNRPDLLVNLKRLTSANKAKMAAGAEVPSQPHNQFQQPHSTLLPPSMLGNANQPGLLTVGQFPQPYQQGNFIPYSYASPAPQNHGALPTHTFGQAPVPSRAGQNPFVLLPGNNTSTAVYSLPVMSLLPLDQWSVNTASSLPKSSSCTPLAQYSQNYYPTAAPTHINTLSSSAVPAAPIYTQCSTLQTQPVQPAYGAEFLPSNLPCNTSDASNTTEVTLEDVFRIVNEMRLPLDPEAVEAELAAIERSAPQFGGSQPLLVTSESSSASSSEGSQPEPLNLVLPETALVSGADGAAACSPVQVSALLHATNAIAHAENAAAEIVQAPVTTQGAYSVAGQQPNYCPTELPLTLQEEPFRPAPTQPVQPAYGAEFLPSNLPCNTSDASNTTEVTLEDVFRIVNEMRLPLDPEAVEAELAAIERSAPQFGGSQPLLVTSESSSASSSEGSQPEPLNLVLPETALVSGADGAAACSPVQVSALLHATNAIAHAENAAAEIVQAPVTTQGAYSVAGQQPSYCPTELPLTLQEEPFRPAPTQPVQPAYGAEFLPSNLPCNTSDASNTTEVTLEDVFRIVNEMRLPLDPEAVEAELAAIERSAPQFGGSQPLLVTSESSSASSSEGSQPEPLNLVLPETALVSGADGAAACSPVQVSALLHATNAIAHAENAAAEIVQAPVTTQGAYNVAGEQPNCWPTELPLIFLQEEPFHPALENISVKSSMSETEEKQFISGTEPVNKFVEETNSSVKRSCRKRRHSSQDNMSPALKLMCFPKEGTGE